MLSHRGVYDYLSYRVYEAGFLYVRYFLRAGYCTWVTVMLVNISKRY